MKKRLLAGNLAVSEIGLGLMGMDHAYGQQLDRKLAVQLIHKALSLGGNFFDTAVIYGTGNEKVLGDALKDRRDQAVIATKFGIIGQKFIAGKSQLKLDSRPEAIRQQVEASLQRLQTDYIDLYYQHRVDPNVEPEVVAETMNNLIKEGKIRYWGLSNASIDYIRRAHTVSPVTALQNQYSMVFRQPEQEVFALCEELGIGFVAYSPLGNGFLSGKFSESTTYDKDDVRQTMGRFTPETMKKNQGVLNLLAKIAAEKQATSAQIVLAWELAQKDYLVPIPGTTKEKRLIENLSASEVSLSKAELQSINHALNQMVIDERYF